jgi:hypothetical protein
MGSLNKDSILTNSSYITYIGGNVIRNLCRAILSKATFFETGEQEDKIILPGVGTSGRWEDIKKNVEGECNGNMCTHI